MDSLNFDQSLSVAVAGWPARKTNPGHWSCLDSPHHSQTVSGTFLRAVSLFGETRSFLQTLKNVSFS